MTDKDKYNEFWKRLFSSNLSSVTNNERPLIAHYTTLNTFEKIIENKEIWFSHPYYMNDYMEFRLGMETIRPLLFNTPTFRDIFTEESDYKVFDKYLHDYWKYFFTTNTTNEMRDVYVFCLSQHDLSPDKHGKLSMWRGYGDVGNGVAIVFDLSKITYIENSPLVIEKVDYTSKEECEEKCNNKIKEFLGHLKELNFSSEGLHYPAFSLIQWAIKISLYIKHDGFSEEKEWRISYIKQAFNQDKDKLLESMLSYHITDRGIQPKFKFKISPIKNITPDDLSLSKIIHSIIIGPTISSDLSRDMIKRMLIKHKETKLIDKIQVSDIPFRPTS